MRRVKFRRDLELAANLSTALAFVVSITNIALSAIALTLRYRCERTTPGGAEYFKEIIIRTYVLHGKCLKSLNIENTTHSDTVYIFAIIAASIAAINLVLAFTVFVVINYVKFPPRSVAIFYAYAGCSLALIAVDFVLGIHVFWKDYDAMTNKLRNTFEGDSKNYIYDMIRLGAMTLAFAAFKGYIGHALNILLLVVLIKCVVVHRKRLQKADEKRASVINAFGFRDEQRQIPVALSDDSNIFDHSHFERRPEDDSRRSRSLRRRNRPFTAHRRSFQRRPVDEPWPTELPHRRQTFSARARSGPLNPAYFGEPTPEAIKEKSISERTMERTQAWIHNTGTRPFSYLESPKNLPVAPPPTPGREPKRRGDAQPPVPEPDYPPTPNDPPPRKLKSALKSSNM